VALIDAPVLLAVTVPEVAAAETWHSHEIGVVALLIVHTTRAVLSKAVPCLLCTALYCLQDHQAVQGDAEP
jgi:hypothetical protein